MRRLAIQIRTKPVKPYRLAAYKTTPADRCRYFSNAPEPVLRFKIKGFLYKKTSIRTGLSHHLNHRQNACLGRVRLSAMPGSDHSIWAKHIVPQAPGLFLLFRGNQYTDTDGFMPLAVDPQEAIHATSDERTSRGLVSTDLIAPGERFRLFFC